MPLTIGYSLPCACIYLALLPAFKNGFSFLPAPATIPIIALHFGLIVRNLPDGNFIVTPSALCAKIIAEEPADLINLPPSPKFFSILQIGVPSGIDSNDNIFLAFAVAPTPTSTLLPTLVPSGAGTYDSVPSSK